MRKMMVIFITLLLVWYSLPILANDFKIGVRTYDGVEDIVGVLPDETLEQKLDKLYYRFPSIEEITSLNGVPLKETEWSKYSGRIPESSKISQMNPNPTKYTEPMIKVIINDEITVWFADQKPIISENRVLIPLRGLFETIKAEVEWDQAQKKVTVKKGEDTIVLKANSKVGYKNGEALALDVPAKIINQRIMVPLRFISESLGCEVTWAANAKYVDIYYKD